MASFMLSSIFVFIPVFALPVASFAQWNSWSACSVECGKGWSSRERIKKLNDCYTELRERRGCEVKCNPKTNLALKKTVITSSVFLSSFPNSNAVDGNKNTDFYGGRSCMMTGKDRHPFLRVDLGRPYYVREVVVYNRGDCCRERLNNFIITVGLRRLRNGTEVCGKGTQMENRNVTTIMCPKNIYGQYVHLLIPGPQFLSLCEIEVYGASLTNIARGKEVSQSTTLSRGYEATKAVDGIYNNYAHTVYNKAPKWWKIDLGRTYTIYEIRIFSDGASGKHLKGSKVSIVNDDGTSSIIGTLNGAPTKGTWYAYTLLFRNGKRARVIKVDMSRSNSNAYLLIREFEIYGL